MPVETDDALNRILELRDVAVVGCSATPEKDAHEVPRYLRAHDYRIHPVNPNRETVLGRPASDTLSAVDGPVELVNVFRPSEEVAGIVDQAVERDDVRAIWTQLDIRDDEAARRAERAGLDVVQDRCMKVEHRRLR